MENLEINSKFWKNKKILLTGNTGFKGSWLSIWLRKLDAEIIGISKKIPREQSLFELTNLEKDIKNINGEITDFEFLKKVIRQYKPEIIIHMAAQPLVQESYRNPIETFSTNVMGTINLLEAVRKTDGVRVVVNVTSDKCYENNNQDLAYKESDPMGGYDPYSCSKGCSELVTASYRNSFFNIGEYKSHGVALASVRAGNVIGGGDWAPDRLIPDIMNNILRNQTIKIRNPSATRPWQFVLEPLHGYLMLVERLWKNGPEFSEAWNFGPDYDDVKPVSWIVEKMTHLWNSDNKIEKDESMFKHEANFLKLDCSKAKNKLGWYPKINLEITLKWIVDWYKQYQKKNNIRRFSEKQIEQYESL